MLTSELCASVVALESDQEPSPGLANAEKQVRGRFVYDWVLLTPTEFPLEFFGLLTGGATASCARSLQLVIAG